MGIKSLSVCEVLLHLVKITVAWKEHYNVTAKQLWTVLIYQVRMLTVLYPPDGVVMKAE